MSMNLLLSAPKEAPIKVTGLLLKLLDVKITDTTLENDLLYHPNYPSLLSISDVLSSYGVENISFECEKGQLSNLPIPFITRIKSDNGGRGFFTIVKSKSSDSVCYYDVDKDKWESSSVQLFLERWNSNVVTIFEVERVFEEKNYTEKRKMEISKRLTSLSTFFAIPLLTIIASIATLINFGMEALYPIIFLVLTLAGGIIGALILWYELDQYNPLLRHLCSYGRNTNCSAVLNSKASKIAGVSWSTIGFIYFSGSLLWLLFNGITNITVLTILGWTSVFSSSYIIFSIFYQWRIAKQWCLLCLSVQLILALQLVASLQFKLITEISDLQIFTPSIILSFAAAYMIPIIVVMLLIPNYQASKENKLIRAELQRMKHDPEIFNSLLVKQEAITFSAHGLGIILGNPNAKNKIIKVCNPLCAPCSASHAPMEALLENNPDVQIQIIFNSYDTPYDKASVPAKHLLAIYKNNKEAFTKAALDDWYLNEKKDYELFAQKFPVNGELEKQSDSLKAMRTWCDQMEVQYTPTFYFNGYKLPEMYKVHDLKYFLSI
jgi:uncharacterized membrane protein